MSGTCACNVVYSVEIKHNFEQRANRCLRTQRGTSSDQRAFSESPLAHKAHVLPMLLIDRCPHSPDDPLPRPPAGITACGRDGIHTI